LLLALTPACVSAPQVARDALPQSLRSIKVAAGCAADYDSLLIGGAA
jgi:hypothetical protein